MRPGALLRAGLGVSDGDTQSPPWPVAHRVLLTGLLALGVALRWSCAIRPYWIDEAWVLNSVRSTTLSEMFAYPEWVQTTPPGLLLLLRGLVQATPQAMDALRWPFMLCGVVSLLLLVRLASNVLGRGFVGLACALFALSPAIVWNATEIKQYSGDALALISSLLLGAAYIRHPTRTGLRHWCLLNLAFLPLSFTAVFSLPAMVVAGVLLSDAPTWRMRLRAVLPHALITAVAVGVLYVVFVRPHAGMASLTSFWAQGFYASSGESPLFYGRRTLSVMFGFLDIKLVPASGAIALIIVSAIGLLGLWRALGKTRQQRVAWICLLVLPVAATLAANLIGVYPVSEYRMVAFLAPCVIIIFALGLEQGARMLFACCAVPTRLKCEQGLGLVLALATAVYMATILNLALWRSAPHGDVWLWRGNTEIRPALHYLREVDALQRPVFVHAYYQQLFKLYTHSAALSAPVSFAQSGWPCCVPGRPWHSYAPDHDEVTQEVTTLVARHGSQPFYVLLYARPSWPSRDSAAVYETQFAARHCATSWRFDTYRVALLKVECAASE